MSRDMQYRCIRSFGLACGILFALCHGDDLAASGWTVDFKNFTYPWVELTLWPDRLEWLSESASKAIRLRNGHWSLPKESRSDRPLHFAGLSFDSVSYGDLTGDTRNEAIVVLRFDTGGTMYHFFVYVYSTVLNRPKLLAFFHSGDRADRGLYRVYSQHGLLVVELYDPERRQGDCCSTGFERTRYRWDGLEFRKVGESEFGEAASTSRRAVSAFGLPEK